MAYENHRRLEEAASASVNGIQGILEQIASATPLSVYVPLATKDGLTLSMADLVWVADRPMAIFQRDGGGPANLANACIELDPRRLSRDRSDKTIYWYEGEVPVPARPSAAT